MGRLKVCPEELAFVEDEVLEYDVPGFDFLQPRVLDIGGNIGAFGAWAMERWPGGHVTSYEPHPDCWRFLAENVGAGWGAVQAAVVSEEEDGRTLDLHAGDNLGALCLSSMRGLYVSERKIPVRCVGANRLPPCDILKVDTEGSELPILKSYPHLRGCSMVAVEWHTPYEEREIASILEHAGLVCYHVKRQKNGTVGVLRYVSKAWAARLPKPWPESDPRPGLMLCVLGWKHSPLHTQSREALVVEAIAQNVDLIIHPEMVSGIERARSICTELFLRTPGPHALGFIDSDIGFDPKDVLTLVRALYTGNIHLAGAAYAKKVHNWERVEAAVKRGEPPEKMPLLSSDLVVNVESMSKLRGMYVEGKRFCIVDNLGTGFMFLSRTLIERYRDAYRYDLEYVRNYAFMNDPDDESTKVHHAFWQHQFDPRHPRMKARDALLDAARRGTGDYNALADAYARACTEEAPPYWLTEDYAFCARAQMLGCPTWCLMDATLAHQGPAVFGARLGEYFPEKQKEAAE